MTKRIEIKVVYPDYESSHRDIIIHSKDGETYIIDKDEVKKIIEVV